MRIAVNTRLLLPNRFDGIGNFTFETLKRITQQHPEHEFIFLFDRKPQPESLFSENITPVVLYPQARHPYLWYLFFEWAVPYALKKYKADLFLSTDGWVSLRTKVPTVNVMHDLGFEHYPSHLKPLFYKYSKYYFPRFAKKAVRLATVSEFSKQDISKLYQIPPDTIDVIYSGTRTDYVPLDAQTQQEVRNQYSQGNPYFLYIGSIHPRKNLENQFKAFDLFKTKTNSPAKFVVVGAKWWGDEINDTLNSLKFKEDILFLGNLPTAEVSRLLASSVALMFVSVFEGFGVPIMEGFHAETAVITGNVSSMPEIAGDAALLADPFSVEEIAEAMQKISEHPDLRQDLIEKGKLRKDLFTWDKTAAKLWECIENSGKMKNEN